MKLSKLIFLFCLAIIVPSVINAQSIPRPEHPRPDLQRSTWQNLNGEWQFSFDPKDIGNKESWQDKSSLDDKIIVPFPVESKLSRIENTNPEKVCWYLRHFDLASGLGWKGDGPGKLMLNFGAVDYKTEVYLNGIKLGEHTGGYTPFSFDVSKFVKPTDNILAVRVWDSKDRMQVRGKQTPKNKSYLIMYTKITGIWQTVWLERVGEPYIKNYRFTPNEDLSGGTFKLSVSSFPDGASPWIKIIAPNGRVEEYSCIKWDGLTAHFKNGVTEPWSPDYPALYQVIMGIDDKDGKTLDEVKSYFGIRSIKVIDGKISLNGKPFYQKLLLDQGYFPGGIYTPENDEIMKADIEMYRQMGFNGIRKHQKVEDPRFLYWCDNLGLVVWEEMPSLGLGGPKHIPGWAMDNFEDEWLDVIDRDYNHPCIITWTVFNENWGVMDMAWSKTRVNWAKDMVQKTRAADSSRLVMDNSGGWHFDTDIWDFHHYLSTAQASVKLYKDYDFSFGDHLGTGYYVGRLLKGVPVLFNFLPGHDYDYKGQPIILSEYGGFGFYKTKDNKGLLEMYSDYTLEINNFPYIQGYCYTQPYDVEQEENGLMTFEREPKYLLMT